MGQVGAERYIIILEKNYKIRNSAKYYIRKKKRGLITRRVFQTNLNYTRSSDETSLRKWHFSGNLKGKEESTR